MEGGLVVRDSSATPRVPAQMKRVLMTFCLIFVLETIVAILASVLFLHLVVSVEKSVLRGRAS